MLGEGRERAGARSFSGCRVRSNRERLRHDAPKDRFSCWWGAAVDGVTRRVPYIDPVLRDIVHLAKELSVPRQTLPRWNEEVDESSATVCDGQVARIEASEFKPLHDFRDRRLVDAGFWSVVRRGRTDQREQLIFDPPIRLVSGVFHRSLLEQVVIQAPARRVRWFCQQHAELFSLAGIVAKGRVHSGEQYSASGWVLHLKSPLSFAGQFVWIASRRPTQEVSGRTSIARSSSCLAPPVESVRAARLQTAAFFRSASLGQSIRTQP
jgi:hypothetical protein